MTRQAFNSLSVEISDDAFISAGRILFQGHVTAAGSDLTVLSGESILLTFDAIDLRVQFEFTLND